MSTAVNGYTGARSGTGLLITAAVHVALGAALLSLGVVKIESIVTPPIKIIKVPPTTPPPDNLDPPAVRDQVDFVYTPPTIDIADVAPPVDLGLTTTTVPNPLTDPGPAIVPPTKSPEPVVAIARLDPRYASRFQPPYPPASERQQEEGVVTVRVRVGVDGRVLAAEVRTSSGHSRLDESAVGHALRAWRFTPATRDGVAVESWREIPVRFEIKNG